MRKKQYIFTILVLVLVSLILGFSGCSNPFQSGQIDDSGQTPAEPDTGNLTVAFGAESARSSVLPDFSGLLQSYVLTAAKDGTTISETRNDVGATQLSGLTYGTWTVTVEGMSGADGSGDVLASGSTDVLIDQASNSVNIDLAYLRAEGQGDIQLTVTVPTSTGVTRITSQFAGGTETDMTITENSGSSEVVFSKENVASGEHDLIIRFYTGEAGSYVSLGNPLVLLVHVFGNITTEKTITVTADSLNSAPAAPGSVAAAAAPGGALVTWSDESHFETAYIVERKPANGAWDEIARLSANTVEFLDDFGGIPDDDHTRTRYRYRVYAENAIGASDAPATEMTNLLGYMHPVSGAFAPVDVDVEAAGYGWGNADWSLGSQFVAGGGSNATIAVYSSAAERILLEIYGTAPAGQPTAGTAITEPIYDYWLEKGTDNIWRAKLENVPHGTYYTFRAWGPGWTWTDEWIRGNSSAGFAADVGTDADGVIGHRFNPNKTVYDPYTREMSHDKENPFLLAKDLTGNIYGTGPVEIGFGAYGTMPRREFDTGIYAPKSIMLDTDALETYPTRPGLNQEDLIIMETHVRGLTRHESAGRIGDILTAADFDFFENVINIPEEKRGTYAGAALMAPYLKGLGFTAIEFIPIHETANDDNREPVDGSTEMLWDTNDPGEVPGNFWGYMTYGFFAPDRRYSSDKSAGGPTREFRQMVQAFTDADIEVILDVVYNHTGEGGDWGDGVTAELTSFKGFDSEQYYMLAGEDDEAGMYFMNFSGTGNTMDFRNQVVRDMTMDSLEYWIHEMGVSGFRFDLAAILGRSNPDYSFDPNSPMLTAIRDLGQINNVKMIAEAWDLGTVQVGNFPDGWMEWNDQFRNPFRDWIRHSVDDGGDAGDFPAGFAGSEAMGFPAPHYNVHYSMSHDGLTMIDQVSYTINSKEERDHHNQTTKNYPFGPSDGGVENNRSWDHVEDQQLRRQQIRNFWTMLMMSRGVPMALYGDELNRTQNGNNNPYKIDTVATWNNYDMIGTNKPHSVPTGTGGEGYHNNYGADDGPADQNAFFGFAQFVTRLRRDHSGLRSNTYASDFNMSGPKGDWANAHAYRTSINGDGSVEDGVFLVLANSSHEGVDFDIWDPGDSYAWRRIIDTNSWAEGNQNFWGPDDEDAWQFAHGIYDFNMPPRTVVVLQKVAIDPADGLMVNIQTPPDDWGALSNLDIGRMNGDTWDGWFMVQGGDLNHSTWYSLFLYPYGEQDYSFIIRFAEDGDQNEVFYDEDEAFFNIANNASEVWIDMTTLDWFADGPPKKFWTAAMTFTQP